MPRMTTARSAAAAGLVIAMLPAAAAPASADTWTFDRTTTEVRFSYDHFGLSRQWGRFRGIEGKLDFTPTDPEDGHVDITIKAAGVSTGVPDLDQLLRSPDFFDAQRNPNITFHSTAVHQTGDKTGDVEGELTMLGVTQTVVLHVTWNFTGEYPLSQINPTYQGKWVSGFSAHTSILRSAWGMKRAIPLISDEINIDIEAEALRQE